MSGKLRIVIAGGGFGGLYAARALARRAAGSLDIALVDRADVFVFKPLLYELLTGEVAEPEIAIAYAGALAGTGVRHVRAEVGAVDLGGRKVVLGDGAELPFDAAAIALGAEPDFRGVPGLAEHVFPAASLAHFRRLREHLAAVGRRPADEPSGTLAVCGAGPSGVEVAAKLAERRRRNGAAAWRIVLVEASATLLPGFSEPMKARALALLREKGVEVRFGTPVRAADAEGLTVGGGERIASRTVIWTAGQRPSPVARALPLERDATGRAIVSATLELPGHPGVFALGDAAHCVQEGLEPPPATAQVAVQQAKVVARNLLARAEGRTLSSFRYFPLAETLSLGRSYDLFSALGVQLEGRAAQLVRRLAYVWRLPGWRQTLYAGTRFGARLAAEAIDAAYTGALARLGGG